MQLEGATELERRTYEVCLRVEREMPASELATTIVTTLSEAGNELQHLRERALGAHSFACRKCSGIFSSADDLERHVDWAH